MQVSQSPITTTESDQHGIGLFNELLWTNAELCSHCFTQVRDIGPEYSKLLKRTGDCRLDLADLDIRVNLWYERTDQGSQEHSPFDSNKRFGTCFCQQCGGDLSASDEDLSLAQLLDIAERIARYVNEETAATVDFGRFTDEIQDLKSKREHQGWDTEILAVSFARSLQSDQTRSDARQPEPA